jgi:hypothetical protein
VVGGNWILLIVGHEQRITGDNLEALTALS